MENNIFPVIAWMEEEQTKVWKTDQEKCVNWNRKQRECVKGGGGGVGVGWGEEEDGKEYVYKMVLTVKENRHEDERD